MKPTIARRDIPGLTFIFSLPAPARSIKDFAPAAPCTLWRPCESLIKTSDSKFIVDGRGQPVRILTYKKGTLSIPFDELKTEILKHAHGTLPWGTAFEIRLALPMGLDTPELTQREDLWRIGWMSHPDLEKTKTPIGLRDSFGYYLLARRIAGTPLILETDANALEEVNEFLGADRPLWANRFRRA